MLLAQILKKLEELAPQSLGLSKDIYGLQFGTKIGMDKKHVTKVLLALDPSKHAIAEAVKIKANLMITHHGLTHNPVMEFNDDLLDKIRLLSENRINLFVIHTAWDAAPSGVAETFVSKCALRIVEPLNFHDGSQKKAIGRICVPYEPITVEKLAQRIKANLDLKYVKIHGKLDAQVNRIAVCPGKGITKESIFTAAEKECDCYITGEATYKEILDIKNFGINLIETSHYASEMPGMESLYRTLSLEFPRTEFAIYKEEENCHFI
jgi:dinuclear metal center YbgI/SA1388 family protein